MPNLNTRIALKYATLAQWEASTLELMNGEVAFAQNTDGSIIMKVGPGVWANAKEISLSELASYYTKDQIDGIVETINKAISDEVKRAGDAEAALQQAIEAEAERALGEEGKLNQAITTEAGRAAAAEGALDIRISGVAKDLTDEIARAKEAETANALAASVAQGKADQAYDLAGQKTTMGEVEAKGYATKEEAQGYANAKDEAIAAAQTTANQAKEAIDAFLDENAVSDDVVNTLKEIQENLNAGGESAGALLAEINKIKDGTTIVPKAADADTLDGKQATEFATAEQGTKADSAIQEADLTGATGDVSITKNEQGKYDIQLRPASIASGDLGAGIVTATHIEADVFKGSNGVKVQKTTEGITYSIDESVEWIFNCGGAN